MFKSYIHLNHIRYHSSRQAQCFWRDTWEVARVGSEDALSTEQCHRANLPISGPRGVLIPASCPHHSHCCDDIQVIVLNILKFEDQSNHLLVVDVGLLMATHNTA
jgi:hypothetical protein